MLTIQKKSVKAGERVSTKHVDTIIKNYKQERWVHNSKRLGKEDSMSVWFSMDELVEFIEAARNHGSDGLRVYFGVYDKDTAVDPSFVGRQTVALVATKERETEKGIMQKDMYVNTENGPSLFGFNMGKICPPACLEGDGNGIGITILDKGEDGMVIV